MSLAPNLYRTQFSEAIRDFLQREATRHHAMEVMGESTADVNAGCGESRNVRLIVDLFGNLRRVTGVPQADAGVGIGYGFMPFLGGLLRLQKPCIEVLEVLLSQVHLEHSVLDDTLEGLVAAEVDVEGLEPGLDEGAGKYADRHFLSSLGAQFDVPEQLAAMAKRCGVVVAEQSTACLVVEDREYTAAQRGADFGQQPLRAISEVFACGLT